MVIQLDAFRPTRDKRRLDVRAWCLISPMGGRLLEAVETLTDDEITAFFRARARYKIQGLRKQ